MGIVFDPAEKRIILDVDTVSATELYSRSCDWLADEDNLKYGAVFRQVGGDDLGGGIGIPPYFFLQGDWRVRPMEADHNLTITGNLFVDGGGVPVVRTLGQWQVNVNYTVPVQAQGVSTSGFVAALLAAAQETPIAADVRDMSGSCDGSLSLLQAHRIILSTLAGVSEKTGNTITFKGVDGVTDRVVGSFDENNNRTGVVLNGI